MLRGRQVMQAKFRRQHYFPKPLRDRRRDAWLAAAGLVVLRLPNHEILHHPARVLDQIRRLLSTHLPAPLSLRERGWG
jgi:hypothetical protein